MCSCSTRPPGLSVMGEGEMIADNCTLFAGSISRKKNLVKTVLFQVFSALLASPSCVLMLRLKWLVVVFVVP